MELRTIFTGVNFPIRPTTLAHKWGGKITTIHGIRHAEISPKDGHSRDFWFFVGDVEWEDGTVSPRTELEPFKLCCDDPASNLELKTCMDAMAEYLAESGAYYTGRPHAGWYAHRKSKAAA